MIIVEKLCDIVDNKWIKLIILIICLSLWCLNFIIIASKDEDDKKTQNNQTNSFIIIFIIFYLYFMACIKIKSACGLHTSFIETLKIWKIFQQPKDIKCFTYSDNTGQHTFGLKNTANIGNINTNVNRSNIKSQLPNINNIDIPISNRKYLWVVLYGIIIILILLCLTIYYSNKENNFDKTVSYLKILISLACFMIFFIWTCVVNLPIWIIILIILFILLLYLFISLIKFLKIFNSRSGNLQKQQLCKPYIIPFVNEQWAGISFNENLNRCISQAHNNLFASSISPLIRVFGTVNEIIIGQGNMITDLNSSLTYFKSQIKIMAQNIFNRIQKIYNTIETLIDDLTNIFNNIFKALESLIGVSKNMGNALSTLHIILGPVISFFNYFCFDEDTLINTRRGDIEIKNIKIGDILSDNSKVIGVQKFIYNKCQMYNYNGIIVSDSHYVSEDDKWIMVKDSKLSKKINYNKRYLYCLITDTHKIHIDNIIFSDYFDCHINQNEVQNIILSKLNGKKSKYNNLPLWAFHKDTLIKTPNGKKKINDFKIGDKTYYGEVLGLIKIKVDNIYKYKNIITTGDQIVLLDGVYLAVKDISSSKKINVKDNIFYHLADSSYKLLINDTMFTDFLQTPETY